jgi:hypothetical protein
MAKIKRNVPVTTQPVAQPTQPVAQPSAQTPVDAPDARKEYSKRMRALSPAKRLAVRISRAISRLESYAKVLNKGGGDDLAGAMVIKAVAFLNDVRQQLDTRPDTWRPVKAKSAKKEKATLKVGSKVGVTGKASAAYEGIVAADDVLTVSELRGKWVIVTLPGGSSIPIRRGHLKVTE